MKRIEFLDGLRGVAILLVIGYHAFSRWPSIVPYGDSYADNIFFKYGYLGVQLFFLISGFVILMSFEKCNTFLQFIYKRWLRLFPTMLLATVLIYLTAQFLYERPAGIPDIYAVFPGLLFMEPAWLKSIIGVPVSPIEGAFWSLFVEFKFYVLFGLCYFIFGRIKAVIAMLLMYLIYVAGTAFDIQLFQTVSNKGSFEYFSWFASGAFAYVYFTCKELKYICISILVALIGLYPYRTDTTLMLSAVFILTIFFIPVYFEKTRYVLTNRFILFFGLVSYPLYLIHENAMIALICKLSKYSGMPYVLLPVVSVGVLVFISYLIVRIAEPFVYKIIVQLVQSVSNRLSTRRHKS